MEKGTKGLKKKSIHIMDKRQPHVMIHKKQVKEKKGK